MRGRSPEAILLRIHTLLVLVVVVAALVWAREICIPLALAALLTFILAPLVARLDRHVGRVCSVMLVLALTTAVTLGVGYVLAQQMYDFATQLPDYHATIQRKLTALQEVTAGQYDRVLRTIEAIRADLPGAAPASGDTSVVVVGSSEQSGAQALIASILPGFGLIALVLLLTVFMLLYREDVRGRILRLAGQGRISLATTAMAETGSRVFRFLVMQVCINCGFGLLVTAGLYAIGLPNPPLWGALAAVLRFIPYVGPWIAAALPTVLALAVANDWSMVLLTVGLFVILELICNNIIEPWLYGSSTGVSPLALILAAVFWGWIWGPIGLVLSTPMTVCLVVIGRHIPRLSFLSILLSDDEPLPPSQEFYHRLLRADLSEATALTERWLKTGNHLGLYEQVYLPALVQAEADYSADELDSERRAALHVGLRDLLEDQALHQQHDRDQPAAGDRRIVCLPARATRDGLAATMLAQLLRQAGCTAHDLDSELTANQLVAATRDADPTAVCILVVAPSASVHVRTLYTKLRHVLPRTPIIITVCGKSDGHLTQQKPPWSQVSVCTTLHDTLTAAGVELADDNARVPETVAQPAKQVPQAVPITPVGRTT